MKEAGKYLLPREKPVNRNRLKNDRGDAISRQGFLQSNCKDAQSVQGYHLI